MFEGFEERRIATTGAEIHCRLAGDGPPLLLLHGYPQTHVMWRHVAPRLAERFRVVAPDLRGYGASSKPPPGERSVAYSKRAMALDMVEVMAQLGHDRFLLAGHDRGGRVAYRLTLDHPDAVERLVTLDIVPTLEQFEAAQRPGGRLPWHWTFLAERSPLPERLIGAEREFVLRWMLEAWMGDVTALEDDAFAAYLAAWTDEAIAASCGDYRAGIGLDCEYDDADRAAGNRIGCPLLVLWGDPGGTRDLVPVWERWATDVRGRGLSCGHFIPEEAPDELLAAMVPFLEEAAW
jgi:haloacetate dehalogenase